MKRTKIELCWPTPRHWDKFLGLATVGVRTQLNKAMDVQVNRMLMTCFTCIDWRDV